MSTIRTPAWLQEIETLLPSIPHFLLSGNTRDRYPVPEQGEGGSVVRLRTLGDTLQQTLSARGFPFLLSFDVNSGAATVPEAHAEEAEEILEISLPRFGRQGSLDSLLDIIERVHSHTTRMALYVERASLLVRKHDDLSEAEFDFFRRIDYLAHAARPTGSPRLFNPVFWQLAGDRDVPPFFAISNSRTRSLALPVPDEATRRIAASIMVSSLKPSSPTSTTDAVELFVQQTVGQTVEAMRSIRSIAMDRGLPAEEVDDAARTYRVGVTDNPWKHDEVRAKLVGRAESPLGEAIPSAEESLSNSVFGQEHAVRKVVDVLARSVAGMTGAHASATAAQPRGVLFFAGPTGVGKTEMAKSLTRLLFLEESAYIRFDMSEFAAEHSADRLIGSPPGYVGFGAGGELTNAIRERPFSVVLFDEIEKAHPKILDKFLQILDDGRLTDGQGQTVFFTEAIIVFTSNLGIYNEVRDETGQVIDRKPNVTPDMDYAVIEQRLTNAIGEFFRHEINRPELLNRMGDNIVVFDFISEPVGRQILNRMIDNVRERVLSEHHVQIELSEAARAALDADCLADLSFGGRGIGSQLETALVDPLARALVFGEDDLRGADVIILDSLTEEEGRWTAILKRP